MGKVERDEEERREEVSLEGLMKEVN